MIPQQRWSQQTIAPTNPRERVQVLVDSPLGSNAWANPLRFGDFTIHDFWEVRREPGHRYSDKFPTGIELAQLMLDTGLKENEIDIAVRVENIDRRQTITSAMQMHRHLRKGHGLSTAYKDALNCLSTAYEASVNLDLGKGSIGAALRNHLCRNDQWVAALHALTQYDNSSEAQNAYLSHIGQMLNPTKNQSPSGTLPTRSRRIDSEESPYNYGWDSSGSAIVQALPQADNAALTKMLHDKHDLHALGAMVVQNRLPFSTFLELAITPAKTPMPEGSDLHRADPTPEKYRQTNAIEVLTALIDMLPQARMRKEARAAFAKDSDLPDKLQAFVAAPNEDESLMNWWSWNLRLYNMDLIDPTKPSAQMREHLEQLKKQLPSSPRHSSRLNFMYAKEFDSNFAAFAKSDVTLSNMAFAILMHSIPNQSKATEIWESMKTIDTSWLSNADCARFITPEILTTAHYGQRNVLPFAAMFLPHMSDVDKAKIAPMVAYNIGVQGVASLSPTTLRSMWKEHNSEAFGAPIPKQYINDTYVLFALTRKNADGLMSTLKSMDVRDDIPVYLQCVESWTRQAMGLPPAIEDIALTDNLFGV